MIGIVSRLAMAAAAIAIFFSPQHAIALALISIAFQIDFISDEAIKFAVWVINQSKQGVK